MQNDTLGATASFATAYLQKLELTGNKVCQGVRIWNNKKT